MCCPSEDSGSETRLLVDGNFSGPSPGEAVSAERVEDGH